MPTKTMQAPTEPEAVYPKVSVKIMVRPTPLDEEIARRLLGWEIESEDELFGDDYLFRDEEGNKVRCYNNTKNRPFNEQWCRTLAQDILNGNWKLNLETVIVGRYGQIVSGQHRLIALVLACQLWRADARRQRVQKEPPVIETLVAFGGSEDEDTTRTIDYVRPRTLGDVLYSSQLFRADTGSDARKVLMRTIDYAVRLLWERTAVAETTPDHARRTHTEALKFIERHPKVLQCVKRIYDEDANGSIRSYANLGYAAGLLYLMAASGDDRDGYVTGGCTEEYLSLPQWDTAEGFWVTFSQTPPSQKGLGLLKTKLGRATRDADRSLTVPEQLAMIVKAWLLWSVGDDVTAAGLWLARTDEGDLDECPTVGGIDVGSKLGGEDEE